MAEEPFIPTKYSELFPYDVTEAQREALLRYAEREGYESGTLRGFHWHLRREAQDYYDILRTESP